MKLSIFLAGIRTQKWLTLYESISNATSIKDYELVFVGPYPLPPELEGIDNVRLIEDWGCPSRCYQLGLLHSRGEYVVWAADDGIFCPTLSIDKAFDSMPKHHKGMVSFSFIEGATAGQRAFGPAFSAKQQKHIAQLKNNPRTMLWTMGENAVLCLAGIPGHYRVVMNALIRRDYFMEIGGWDCRFEHIGVGSNDLAVRLQNDGAEVIVGDEFMDLDQEFATPDHLPIEQSHIENDLVLIKSIYGDPASQGKTKIDFDNWKKAPEVWTRRFKAKS